jgi:glycosyltransferase involved in cell wall biosynthesis
MSETPNTSIVILTKNAGPEFRSTLSQIYSQETQHAFEVVIVDSGSTDQTLEIMNLFPVRKFTIPPSEFNFGLTRNYAFSLARGDYVATLSQDAVPLNKHWLQNLIQPFLLNPNIVAVQGAQRKPEDRPIFYWEQTGHFHFTSESRKWKEKHHIGLSFVNCAVRRTFWAIHPIGFTPWAEDKLFQTLIHAAGGEIALAKDAICVHGHNYTFRRLVRALHQEGTGWKHAGMEYHFRDCISDIIKNKWMLREAFAALRRREIRSWNEFLYLFLRPPCLYWGNRAGLRSLKKLEGPE